MSVYFKLFTKVWIQSDRNFKMYQRLFTVTILVAVSLLVTVECRSNNRRSNDRQNLWNPNNSNAGGYSYQTNLNNNNNNNNNNNEGPGPRFDYDTGFATGVAMKKALGLTKIVLSPIVLPMIFFVGIVLLVFFAVVGSSAVVGSALQGKRRQQHYPQNDYFAKRLSSSTAKLASDVLSSDQCIERISCEVFKKARKLGADDDLILSTLKEIPSSETMIGRISRSIKKASDCQKFTCSSLSIVSRAMQAFRG